MRRAIPLCTSWLLCASVGAALCLTIEQERDRGNAESTLVGRLHSETGAWRSRTQQVFDPVTRALDRRSYTVWDWEPSRNLDFVWIPDVLEGEREGPVNGKGRLIWRSKGMPAYDPDALVAEFHGVLRDGRPEGRGRYIESSGLMYEGEWQNGLMEGHGRLKLATMDEYIGQFRAGKANGAGRYVDVTGETFEGSFVDGLRDGLGTTRLPNGFSYRSSWKSGEEMPESRAIRVSQIGQQRLQSPIRDIRVAVGIKEVGYQSLNDGATLVIRPPDSKLSAWKGNADIAKAEASALSWGGDAGELVIRIGVQNISPRQQQVSGLGFYVQSSSTDPQPAVFANAGRKNDCGEFFYLPVVMFQNFGWSAAEDAVYRFAFAPVGTTSSAGSGGQQIFSKRLGRIDRTITVDLERELHSAGADTNLFRKVADGLLPCASKNDAICLAELKRSGALGSLAQLINTQPNQKLQLAVDAVGTLEYTWFNNRGERRRRVSPVIARMQLGHFRAPNQACAENAQEETLPRAVSLELDRTNYFVPVPISDRPLPPSRMANFSVPIVAAKSSQHEFQVIVQLADGIRVSSRPIRLLYYAPRK